MDELLTRSVSKIYPSAHALKKVLDSGHRLRIYVGADATAPQLHLGHSTNYIILEKFRKLGHKVFILFGDFTAMIGDPVDKLATRPQLSKEEVEKNIKTWKKQLAPIINFQDKNNPAKVVKNSTWLSKLSAKQILDLMANFTVQQISERDMFAKRLADHKPVYSHELVYPLLQGYDSVKLDVDLEIGGTDQTFNMLVGRSLQKIYNNREKFVLTTTLLENPKTGKKLMSKSEDNYIALNDKPNDMFGKIMALPDEAIRQMFLDCTYVPLLEIEERTKGNPLSAKKKLAFEIVKIYHGKTAAGAARESFEKTFQKKEIPENPPEIKARKGELLAEVLIRAGAVKSKSEFARLVAAGAIVDLATNAKLSTINYGLSTALTIRVGKKTFIKIII